MARRITKTVVDALSIPDKGYEICWDDALRGFGVRVTASGVKSFILQYRATGKSRRITLGRYGILTVEKARKEATIHLGKVAAGQDPVATKVAGELKTATLKEVFEAYLETRVLKPSTVKDMRFAFQGLNSWISQPLMNITREMVARKHRTLGEKSKARANLTFRYLRAVFNFAAGRYTDTEGNPLIVDNPVKRLSETRAWYRIDRRQTVIKPHQLKPWMKAVLSLKDESIQYTFETVSDFLMLLILTGLRRSEAQTLLWDQVDFEDRSLTVLDTKNHDDHTIPLSDYLFKLLSRRRKTATNEYVFTASRGHGHLREPRKAILQVIEKSGVPFTVHDLRRTFATVADSLDVPGYAVKALLNHKSSGDVTAGYIIRDVDRLRVPMQRITDYMLEKGGYGSQND